MPKYRPDLVTNLPEDAPNYSAAEYLFGDLETRKKNERELQQTDAIDAIKSKYKMAEMEKNNTLNTEFERMKQSWHDTQTQAQWQHQDALAQRQGQGILDVIGERAVGEAQGGNIMEGFVNTNLPPAGAAAENEPATYTPRQMNPLGAHVAATDFQSAMSNKYAGERQTQLAQTNAAERLFARQEDRIGDDEVAQAKQVAGSLDATNPATAALLRSFQPGTVSKKDFSHALQVAVTQAEAVTSRLKTAEMSTDARIQSAQIYADSRKEVAALLAKSRLDKNDEAQLNRNIADAARQVGQRTTDIGQLARSLSDPFLPDAERRRYTEEQSRHMVIRDTWQQRHNDLLNKQRDSSLHTPATMAVDDKEQLASMMRRVMSEKYPNKNFEKLPKEKQDEVFGLAQQRLKDKANVPGAANQ